MSFETEMKARGMFPKKKKKKKKKGASPTKGRRVVLRTGKVNYEKSSTRGRGFCSANTYVSPDTTMMW